MKPVGMSPCSRCGEPDQRKEYRLDGQDKFGYTIKIVEKCSHCGQSYQMISK